jgi:hypothetical protein
MGRPLESRTQAQTGKKPSYAMLITKQISTPPILATLNVMVLEHQLAIPSRLPQ